jgi:hypothetical protein
MNEMLLEATAANRIRVRTGAALAEEVWTAIDSVRNGLRADLETGGYKAIVILKQLPVMQCDRCSEYSIEDTVFAWKIC